MADKTIPDLTLVALATGYSFPFAIDAGTEAKKQTIDGLSRFIYQNYVASQPATYYTDSLGVNYGGFGVFGNLYVSGKFHANGTGYLDSISAGSVDSNTIGNPTSHIIAGPSSVIQRATYCAIVGGAGALIKHGANNVFVGGGLNSVIEGDSDGSICLGGSNNLLGSVNSLVAGGVSNTASGSATVVIGGTTNTNNGVASSILGGSSNNISNLSVRSSIIAGSSNNVTGTYSVIVGGLSNIISGDYSSIVGGDLNSVLTDRCSVISTQGATVKRGANNTFIGGGLNLVVEGDSNGSVALGGSSNTLGSVNSLVAGGVSNFSSGSATVVVGGTSNRNTSARGGIFAGTTSSLTGTNSVVLGGQTNSLSGTNSVIVGGQSNYLVNGLSSAIFGGVGNINSGNYSMVFGGQNISVPQNHYGAFVFADSKTTSRRSKNADSATFHFASGVCVSGSSFEVERTGAFYGGVSAGTGRHVFTTLTGFFANPNSALSATSYSGILIPAPGVNYGDFVIVETNTYSGNSFGAPGGSLMQFAPQAYPNEIRMFVYNPNGSSININSDMRWIAFKTNPLGLI